MLIIENLSEKQLNVSEVVKRVQDVSQRVLTVAVDYLGNIDYQLYIKRSAPDFVPVISRDQKGNMPESIRDVLGTIAH